MSDGFSGADPGAAEDRKYVLCAAVIRGIICEYRRQIVEVVKKTSSTAVSAGLFTVTLTSLIPFGAFAPGESVISRARSVSGSLRASSLKGFSGSSYIS